MKIGVGTLSKSQQLENSFIRATMIISELFCKTLNETYRRTRVVWSYYRVYGLHDVFYDIVIFVIMYNNTVDYDAVRKKKKRGRKTVWGIMDYVDY